MQTPGLPRAILLSGLCAILFGFFSCNFNDPVKFAADSSDSCGDGTTDSGETCDGDCPSCDDDDPCTEDATAGSPETCDVVCTNTPIDDCGVPVCGNGTVEANETCDGDCPATCDDGDDCTTDAGLGSADTCNVECVNATIPGCVPSLCGNGTVDSGETCDGNCPTSCDDGDACTTNSATGTISQCNVTCTTTDVLACLSGDGCCPSGCTYDRDNDCPCVPTTCAAAGQSCGPPLDDGCGQMLDCGPCGTNETCLGTQCQASGGVGGTCPAGCPTGDCYDDVYSGYPPGGYCTALCINGDTDCPMGTHCGGASLCLQTCTADSECRSPYYECYDNDSDGRSECAPIGTGGGAIGAPCDNTSQCAGGQGAKCIPEYVPTNEWADGYCSQRCSATIACPAGTSCYGDSCVTNCVGPADCRGAGYNCFDGNNDGQRECLPWLGMSVVGDPCVLNSDCTGGAFDAWGICRQPYTDGAGVPHVPNGYCTSQCGPGQGSCEPGVVCHDFDGMGNFYGCLIPCSAAGTCPLVGQECLATTSGLLCL